MDGPPSDNQQLEDGTTKEIDGMTYVFDAERGRWVPESQYREERGKDTKVPDFTEEDFEYCNGNIYSIDCFASMMYTFGNGKKGLALMQNWINEVTLGNWFAVIFLWPFYCLAWFFTSWILIFDPDALPPAANF